MAAGDYYPYLLAAVSQNNVLPLTSRCNLGCIFCSHRQNPPGVTTYRLPPLPTEKALDLAQFLDRDKPIVIGESATRIDEGEPFTHPGLMAILQGLRHKFPATKLTLTTNGTLLDEEAVRELAGLQPLELTISLNSSTAGGRKTLLHDGQPERVLAAVTMLSRFNVPFHGSMVAMPHITGWEDMNETTGFLANQGALTIRVFLPGYTGLAPDKLRFPLSLWSGMLAWAKGRTAELGIPVLPEPALCRDVAPEIYGIIRNSPATAAGLKADDLIRQVDGEEMQSRVHAYRRARLAKNPEIRFLRDGEEKTVTLIKKSGEAPGFAVLYDFDPQRLADIAATIKHSHSTAPLLLASEFAAPLLSKLAGRLQLSAAAVVPVVNSFFGGSIQAAGLLTVKDFLAAAQNAAAEQAPDLVLVPREAFDPQGLDLTRAPLAELSHALGVPVRAV